MSGKTYINLRGEEYEAMIPGTKCPVSAGVLEQWYWDKKMSCAEISLKLLDMGFKCSEQSIRHYMKIANIKKRLPGDAIRVYIKKNGFPERHYTRPRGRCSDDISRANLQKAICASVKLRTTKGRITKKCSYCGNSMSVKLSMLSRGEGKYCSRECRLQGNIGIKYKTKNTAIKGMTCPYCFSNLLLSEGQRKGYRSFGCKNCARKTIRPIIEFGLRQDLEAAGALDDGRILASAFKPKDDA